MNKEQATMIVEDHISWLEGPGDRQTVAMALKVIFHEMGIDFANGRVRFDSLNSGDRFSYDGLELMKVVYSSWNSSCSNHVNVVNLKTGTLGYVGPDTKVQKLHPINYSA